MVYSKRDESPNKQKVGCYQMRLVRYSHKDKVGFAVLEADQVKVLDGHPVGELHYTGEVLAMPDIRLLAPIIPSKIVCIGKNYREHALEMGSEPPTEPLFFFKPTTSIIGPEDAIQLPKQSEDVQHESELAIVISRLCKDVPVERVADVILGYTCANDVTARDLQHRDGQWARSKGFDTFCPLGPWIETELADPQNVKIECRLNGQVTQSASANQMIHSIADIVSWVSHHITLLPGDVILTGSPAGISRMVAGDIVEVEIAGIGILRNKVASFE
jgi:2-keto-4-pentenoate hydratase/2-oxohepta-3-ene-1,7-dioic acid hydratase in catechol pathway